MQIWIAHPELKTLPPMPDTATTDITLRRLQQFKIERGKSYAWQLSRDGHALASGKLITLCGFLGHGPLPMRKSTCADYSFSSLLVNGS